MKCKDVLKILGCTRQTLSRYVKDGTIKAIKMPNGYYDYNDDSVYAFIGLKKKKTNKKIISYSRVSTGTQKSQLKEQTQRIYDSCIARGLVLDEQFKDVKSGMNFDRKSFDKVVELIIKGEVQMLVIENKDRLVRFGFEGFEKIFKYFGCTILVLNDKIENKTYEQEMAEDLVSIIHYFTMKSYSHRRKLNKIRRDLEEDENKERESLNNEDSILNN